MKVIVHNVVIDRDTMTKPSKQVWDWELPILQEKFPGGLVKVNGSTTVDREELPEAGDEFIRLSAMYGTEEGTKQSFVDIVYGRGEKGIKKLAKALQSAIELTPAEKRAATMAAKAEAEAQAEAEAKAKAEADAKAEAEEAAEAKDPLS